MTKPKRKVPIKPESEGKEEESVEKELDGRDAWVPAFGNGCRCRPSTFWRRCIHLSDHHASDECNFALLLPLPLQRSIAHFSDQFSQCSLCVPLLYMALCATLAAVLVYTPLDDWHVNVPMYFQLFWNY